MSSEVMVESGRYNLNNMLIQINEDQIYLSGLDNAPFAKIDTVEKIKGGYHVGYIYLLGKNKGRRHHGKIKYLSKKMKDRACT